MSNSVNLEFFNRLNEELSQWAARQPDPSKERASTAGLSATILSIPSAVDHGSRPLSGRVTPEEARNPNPSPVSVPNEPKLHPQDPPPSCPVSPLQLNSGITWDDLPDAEIVWGDDPDVDIPFEEIFEDDSSLSGSCSSISTTDVSSS